jgi:hypothetical protein
MAAPRLNDSQKEELVARYRSGETAQALAAAYGCSPNTVSRVLKAALDPEEMASIKRQSRGRAAESETLESPAVEAPVVVAVAASDPADDGEGAVEAEQSELAVDDADDFADDGFDEGDNLDDTEADDGAVEPVVALQPGVVLEPQPLVPGVLPASVYMLVDKTVELQAKPLREFPELGTLPETEQELQALMLYTNPRQAKRQCGRTQRVIKVPDAGVLERRSSYLVAQGITRLVVEGGSLFALAGS